MFILVSCLNKPTRNHLLFVVKLYEYEYRRNHGDTRDSVAHAHWRPIFTMLF